MASFALGTTAGDLAAEGLQLGYANSALIFGALVGAVTIAYVLTRQFGASCGDLLSRPVVNGGLGLGSVVTSAIILLTILGLVAYLTATDRRLAERI
ncbi:MAG: repeat uncharacterized protein DUF347 [Candidatus Accumulibacter regalis]